MIVLAASGMNPQILNALKARRREKLCAGRPCRSEDWPV